MTEARYETSLDPRGERRLFVMLKLLAALGTSLEYRSLRSAANVAVPVTAAEAVQDRNGRPLWDRRIVHASDRLADAGLLTRGPWKLTEDGLRAVDQAATPEEFWRERRPQRTSWSRAAGLNTQAPKNVILYGPPGTGKTYNTINHALDCLGEEAPKSREEARAAFDEHVDAGHIRFVTFHQAFSYEDFVEGIRPSTEATGISYKVADGIFKEMADRAAGDRDQAYVLIVDEINRGNVSGIFGELITLIEEDKRSGAAEQLRVVLPYSNEEFAVPANLFLIGTMNTADRSLAGLDLALRRRFQFVEMPPRPDMLQAASVPGVDVKLFLQRLNERLQSLKGRDFAIGHAFFMPLLEDGSLARLREVVERKVVPLLQEYFFEDEQQIAEVLGQPDFTDSDANLLVKGVTPVKNGNPVWRYDRSVLDRAAFYRQVISGRAGTDESDALAVPGVDRASDYESEEAA